MIRLLVKSLYIITLLALILTSIAAFLFGTTTGLHTIIKLGKLYVPGTLKIHHIEGSVLNNFSLAEVAYTSKKINLKIKQLNVQWQPHLIKESQLITVQWQNLHADIGKDKIIDSLQGNAIVTGILPNLQISLKTQLSAAPENYWLMDTKIRGTLPWKWTFDAQLSPAQNTSAKQAGLHAKLSIKGKISSKNQGNLLLTIQPGLYQLPDNETIPTLQFIGGTLKITLSPERLKGSGIFKIDQNKNLTLEFQLPKFTLNTELKDKQTLSAELSLQVSSLDFLQNLSPDINNLKGQLLASLMVKGTVSNTQIDSKISLSKTSFSLPKLGIDLNNLQINAQGKRNTWEATGSVASAGHHLLITGKGNLSSKFVADLKLEGNDFPLMKTNEYQIHISPNVNLHLTPTTQVLSGTILVPYAEIKPQTFNNSISLPEDVVYKHKEKASSSPSMGSMDIDIEMGKEVAINVKGLKGHLDGTLHVKQAAQGSINAYGELSVNKGTYKAYGQDLTIQQGELIFTGGPINNPGINLRAAKKIKSTPTTFSSSSQLLDFNSNNQQDVTFGETMTLGVEVTGRLTHPKIQLFSDPATLSQADILSMLVLGRPANQANKAGGQLLLTAISSMSLGSNTNSLRLLEQLKQSAGIDFNVQTNTNYNQATNTASDSTAFVVGKSLSKRLYLSYNIGLSQTDTNILTLRYILNKFFSIQVSNSDTSSAIDILYTSNKKNKLKPKKND